MGSAVGWAVGSAVGWVVGSDVGAVGAEVGGGRIITSDQRTLLQVKRSSAAAPITIASRLTVKAAGSRL